MPRVGILDESNVTPDRIVKFYVTAVLACPSENLGPLSRAVEQIRGRYGFQAGDRFKWEAHSRPHSVTPAGHREAKQAVLGLLGTHGLVFLPVLVHHHVAVHKPRRTLVEWSANMAIRLWENFLAGVGDDGVLILDRRPAGDEGTYLRSVFSRVPEPETGRDFSLKRTHILGYTMEGASHLLSVLDITLGGFCYALNERRPEHSRVASDLLRAVVSAMWHIGYPNGKRVLRRNGYAFLPIANRSPRVQTDYAELVKHWNALLGRPPDGPLNPVV